MNRFTAKFLFILFSCFPAVSQASPQNAPSFESYSFPSANEPQTIPLQPIGSASVIGSESASPTPALASAEFSIAAANIYSSDIQNIVAACNHEPSKLFAFVHDHIQFTPYAGFRKGADFTWLTRAGNDADQADLLVTLLRAAGYADAQFETGDVSMTTALARAWIGADNDDALLRIAGSAGYQAAINGGNFVTRQTWVSATIGGTSQRFFPAYKTYITNASIDIGAALGYLRADLMTAAGGVETATAVQGVLDNDLEEYLRARGTDLVNYLNTEKPNAALDGIIGGRRIVPLAESLSGGSLPPGLTATNTVLFASPSDTHSALFTVLVGQSDGQGGLASIRAGFSNFHCRDIGSKKISVTFAADTGRAQVWLDEELLSQEAIPIALGQMAIGIQITHPFSPNPFTRFRVFNAQRSGTYVVLNNPSGLHSPLVSTRRRELLRSHQDAGLTANSREIRTEALHLLGLDYMAQWEQAVRLFSQIASFEPIIHHSLAIIHQESGFGVDIPFLTSFVPRDNSDAKFFNNNRVAAVLGSAMEHGVIDQSYPDRTGMSTVRHLRRNNLEGKKTYLATGQNYSTIAQDSDFIAGWPAVYRNSVFPNSFPFWTQLIIPENGQRQDDQLEGNGYMLARDGSTACVITSPTYTLKGGYTTTTGLIDPSETPGVIEPTEGPEALSNPESAEPVDLFTGAYVSDTLDLSVGGAGVRGLQFSRNYSSAAKDADSELGYGWSHSYRSFLSFYTDPKLALGYGTPEQTANAITGLYILNDLLANETATAKGWLVSAITSGWFVGQIYYNAIDVTVGRKNFTFTYRPDNVTFSSPAGVATRLILDEVSFLFRLEDRFGITTYFNETDRVESVVDADERQLSFAYNGDGLLQTVTDCYSRSLTFAYNQDRLQSVTDSTGRVVSYTYDEGYLESVTDPENHTSGFTYDTSGRIWKVANQLNEEMVENTYDDRGRVIEQIAEGDPLKSWRYAITGLRNTETDPLGNMKTYLYDQKGRNIAFIDGEGNMSRMFYDGQDHLVKTIDARNHATDFEYDGRHNLRFVTNANSHTTEMFYDGLDRLDYILDPLGKKTDYTFDAAHHLTHVQDAELRTTTFVYHPSGAAKGLLWKTIAPNTDTTTIVYDGNGHPQTVTRADASVVSTTFNARGDLTHASIATVGDPNTHAQTMVYDKRRRLRSSTNLLNQVSSWTYDPRDRPTHFTDVAGRVAAAQTSAWGSVLKIAAPTGAQTIVSQDLAGRREKVKDALLKETTFVYDGANRLTDIIDPLNQETGFGYDPVGNLETLTNPRSKTWTWTRTALNQVDTLASPLNRVWDHNYDGRDLLHEVKQPSNALSVFTYWDDGRLKRIADPVGSIDFVYDSNGRLDTVNSGAAVLDRDWDKLDRLEKFTDSAGNEIGYRYDGAGNLTELTYPDNKKVTYVHDAAGRLDFMTDWANRVTDFSYNDRGQLEWIIFPNGTRRDINYDDAGRAYFVRDSYAPQGPGDPSVITQTRLIYDALDRVWREVRDAIGPYSVPALAATFDDDDRPVTWNTQTCVNDPNGNLTTGPLQGALATFVYNDRNQLTVAGSAGYAYDAEGRRISKTELGATTTYVRDPNALLSRLLVRVKEGVATRTVHALGMVLYEETGSALRVFHYDARGSTVAMTDENGEWIESLSYGLYGELISRSGTTDTPFLFHGAWGVETDANGLLHMRARYYSAETRRFLNADPSGFTGGLNHYAFAGGRPTSNIDPLGLWNLFNPGTWGDGTGFKGIDSLNPVGDSAHWGAMDYDTLGKSAQAALDGINPVSNYFLENGGYDPNDPALAFSRSAAGVARDLYTGAGVVRGLQRFGAAVSGEQLSGTFWGQLQQAGAGWAAREQFFRIGAQELGTWAVFAMNAGTVYMLPEAVRSFIGHVERWENAAKCLKKSL